ncbi:MAG: tetratricopeptide repeat protein [Bryobacteraceae bacterium]
MMSPPNAVLCLASLLIAQPLFAAGCETFVGKWAWFAGGEVTVASDGTFTQQSGATGTWTCTDSAKGIVTMKWSTGFVNTMLIAADGRRLSSTDRSQAFVSARRVDNAPPQQPQQQQQQPPPPPPSQSGTGSDETAFAQGRKLAASGQCQAAIPYLDQAIRINPRHSLALSDRGRCKAILGQPAQGLADLDLAVKAAPDEMGPYYNRAGLKADAGDGDGALADLDWSIRLMPMNAAGHAARAGLMEVMGHAAEARLDRDLAYKLIDTFKSSQRATADRVLQTWTAKRVRPASASPGAGNPVVFAARALNEGRTRAALATLDAALAARPGDVSILAFRARLHREIGQPTQALEDLARVPQTAASASLLVEKGRALRQLCLFKEEAAQYTQAIRMDPRYVPAYFERAFTVMFFNKGEDAIPDLTKVIELDPNHWLAYNYRGDLNRYWFHLRESIADFRRSIAINPNFAQSQCNLAFALRSGRIMQEADQWLAKCFALDPSEREVARREYAKIKAGEEQGARDFKSHMQWLHWKLYGHDTHDNKQACNQGTGTWMGPDRASDGGWCWN